MVEIKLLDGKDYKVEDLLSKMYNDDFYYNEMGTNKALSYSTAKMLLKSPKLFDNMTRSHMKETQALRDGKLIHTQILEPHKYAKFNFVEASTRATKAFKDAVVESGASNTFTVKERNACDRVSSAFLNNSSCTNFLERGLTEVPGLVTYEGIPFRAKADILGADFVADVKTTSDGVSDITLANGSTKNQFAYTVSKYDYDMQAYLYTRVFDVPDFYWLVIDKTTTDIGIFKASQDTLDRGRAKLDEAVGIYGMIFVDKFIDLNELHVNQVI
jgi:hypothetical protein